MAIFGLVALLGLAWAESSSLPLLVINASRIYSFDSLVQRPAAFCVGEDGRFKAIGTEDAVRHACAGEYQVLDAAGAVVLPGLIDAHAHPMDEGRRLSIADLSKAKSEEEAVAAAAAFAHSDPPKPGAFLLGFGWDQNGWAGEFPSRRSLDKALPAELPAYLDRIDGHAAWVNSAALRLSGVNRSTPDPQGGRIIRDSDGEATGVLLDSAKALVTRFIPEPSAAERKLWFTRCLKECADLGLTGLHDMGQDPSNLEMFSGMAKDGTLTLRLNSLRLGRDEPGMGRGGHPEDAKIDDELLKVRGVKFFLDGALGSWGAAMLENYTDRPDLSGSLRMSLEELKAAIKPWIEAGWQVAIHAIGDRANRVALDAYEVLLKELQLEGSDHRFRIEHAQVLSPSDIPRFGKLGILPSMQPDHAMFDMPWAEKRLGKQRLAGAYAWRKVLNFARALPFGSDFPTAGVVNPWWGIYAAVTRQDLSGQPVGGWLPEERLSVHEAVRGYTLAAAFAAKAEALQGSISVGKFGDFVLIDRDIFQVQHLQIPTTKVIGTFVGGRLVGGEMKSKEVDIVA